MADYIYNDEAAQIAAEIIPDWHPHLGALKIAHLSKLVAPKKNKKPPREGKKVTMAKTSKVSDKIRMIAGEDYRFIIEYDDSIWQTLTPDEQRALVDHELAHCGNDIDGIYLKQHSVEDFSEVIQRHGAWHSDTLQFLEAVDGTYHEGKKNMEPTG